MPPLMYSRPLIKLSGEALMGNGQYGIDMDALDAIALDLAGVSRLGVRAAVVVGAAISSGGYQVRPAAWTASRPISWECWRR